VDSNFDNREAKIAGQKRGDLDVKAEKLGWLSVILASVCCVLPLAAVLVGLGSVGLGAILGGLGIYFDLGGLVVLAVAWFYFLRERRRAYALNSSIRGERRTMAALSVATVLVVVFAGSGLAPAIMRIVAPPTTIVQAAQARMTQDASSNPAGYVRKVLAVKGMNCVACIPEIKSSLAKVQGVRSADVSLRDQTVTVEYNPAKASAQQLVKAVKAAGYDAQLVN
jgi:copper chaperone